MTEENTEQEQENTAQTVSEPEVIENLQSDGKNNTYILKERYTIDFSSPLAWLNSNGAKAYKVEDKINNKKEFLQVGF